MEKYTVIADSVSGKGKIHKQGADVTSDHFSSPAIVKDLVRKLFIAPKGAIAPKPWEDINIDALKDGLDRAKIEYDPASDKETLYKLMYPSVPAQPLTDEDLEKKEAKGNEVKNPLITEISPKNIKKKLKQKNIAFEEDADKETLYNLLFPRPEE